MKTIVQINSVAYGSTGNIMKNILKLSKENGFQTFSFVGHDNARDNNTFRIGNKLSNLSCIFFSFIGLDGHGAIFSTKKFIKKLKELNPDIIHIHNIHGYYLNYKIFFNYLKKEFKGKVVWTLHDCWPITGHCSHFSFVECSKWKTECKNCPQLNTYPKEIIDTSKYKYQIKKKLFTNIKNLTIITPSKWLANVIRQSFLKEYEIKVINNGIDLSIFKKYESKELIDIYKRYKLPQDKKIILGVSNGWNIKKGLNDFIELSKVIDKNKYQIVLVGTDEKTEKIIPNEIITIQRTDNQRDLAKLYNIAHKYLNFSIEETFGLTTIEAMVCGTPVIVYNKTAIPECVSFNSGYVVKNYESRINEVINHLEDNYIEKNIIEQGKKFECNKKYQEYIDLFKKIL